MVQLLKAGPILIVLALGGAAANSASDLSPCLPPSAESADMLDQYRWVDTTTDTRQIAWRQGIGLPSIAASQITLVTDTAVCRRGVAAFNSILAGDSLAPSSSVNVIRYGTTRYVIGDPAHIVGEWAMEAVVDTSFAKIAISGR